jgi:hypothetical protein
MDRRRKTDLQQAGEVSGIFTVVCTKKSVSVSSLSISGISVRQVPRKYQSNSQHLPEDTKNAYTHRERRLLILNTHIC